MTSTNNNAENTQNIYPSDGELRDQDNQQEDIHHVVDILVAVPVGIQLEKDTQREDIHQEEDTQMVDIRQEEDNLQEDMHLEEEDKGMPHVAVDSVQQHIQQDVKITLCPDYHHCLPLLLTLDC